MANDHRLSFERLIEMRNDESSEVRYSVAETQRFKMKMYAPLLQDTDVDVREAAALNVLRFGEEWGKQNSTLFVSEIPSLAQQIRGVSKLLMRLVNDSDESIRILLAGHSNTPARVLKGLVDDPSPAVQEELKARYQFPRDAVVCSHKKPDFSEDRFFGSIRLCPNVLARLAKSSNQYIRGMVARNNQCPARVWHELNGQNHWFISAMAKQNPKFKYTKK